MHELEVRQLQDAVLVYEEVARPDVAVDQAQAVYVLERGDDVEAEDAHGGFGQVAVLQHEGLQIRASAVLQDEPEVVAGLVPVVELEHVH
eukprot:CAMPEP_0173176526 /NCGR_PEP_ID=MMETSP1141-20130122/4501_1 /TAXON_ID=483371 /ORGANISM="non described non described, Strain CCMP2298" /LENGTH=89 /DNA_ID=CAMNT_0014098859 /DNA_START=543 /DNA_END=812 /DNA_ORIENTATION=-